MQGTGDALLFCTIGIAARGHWQLRPFGTSSPRVFCHHHCQRIRPPWHGSGCTRACRRRDVDVERPAGAWAVGTHFHRGLVCWEATDRTNPFANKADHAADTISTWRGRGGGCCVRRPPPWPAPCVGVLRCRATPTGCEPTLATCSMRRCATQACTASTTPARSMGAASPSRRRQKAAPPTARYVTLKGATLRCPT